MRTFTFFIRDRRYSIPTLDVVNLRDDAMAREVAQKRLEDSNFHQAVDVWKDEALVFRVARGQPAGED